MKLQKYNLSAIITAVVVTATVLPAQDYVPGELIVKFQHGILEMDGVEETPFSQVVINDQNLADSLQSFGTESVEKLFKTDDAQAGETYIDVSQVCLLRVDPGLDIERVAEQLEELPGVIYAEPNYIGEFFARYPVDENFDYQQGFTADDYLWYLHNETSGWWDINAPEAWDIETGNFNIKLAIIDAGFSEDHFLTPGGEFYGRVVGTASFDEQTYAVYEVDHYHGTVVTGVAAANTNDFQYGLDDIHGVAGVAGGWGTGSGIDPSEKGVSLLLGQSGPSPWLSFCSYAIHWARSEGASVINYSIGGSSLGSEILLEQMINALKDDVTFCAASGNDFDEGGGYPYLMYPARFAKYNLCCAVGSIDSFGLRAYHSHYGPGLSVVAPGTFINSTFNPDYPHEDPTNLFYTWGVRDLLGFHDKWPTGTSVATPHAAGVASLLYSRALEKGFELSDAGQPLWDIDCQRILELSAKFNFYDYAPDTFINGSPWNEEIGFGCVDAKAALDLIDDEDHNFVHGTLTQYTTSFYATPYAHIVRFVREPLPGFDPGLYACKVFDVSGNLSISSDLVFLGVWGRLFDGSPGYSPDFDSNPAFPCVIGGDETTLPNFANLHTFVYELLAYDANNNEEFEDEEFYVNSFWAPRDTSEIEIAYTYISAPRNQHTYGPQSNGPSVCKPELSILSSNIDRHKKVRFQIPSATITQIAVYDVSGQKVKTLVSGQQTSGSHELVWDGLDDAGHSVSAGVYFVRMQTETWRDAQKVILIR
ncbi:S8 family serine peptidase [candidate division WOR-3 bacterium]|uniref:S8 family serine peptidase n=1 Tax=candidate division WOR-3 bacterium TaxID=2052148 RepID=A0A9D5K817_UNCW3|nr:S8 family serine peptidase [candidate division WOR-3 bacterium]MBD3363982.1 S8 family serine peptidase [candidate division WOR-3 bacterium]